MSDSELSFKLNGSSGSLHSTGLVSPNAKYVSINVTSKDIPQVRTRLAKAAEEAKIKKSKKPEDEENLKSTSQLHLVADWRKVRRAMNLDFMDDQREEFMPLVPALSQEAVILDDLLSCLTGHQGEYIVAAPLTSAQGKRTFVIADSTEPHLATLAQKTLDVASHYSFVVRFIQDNRLMPVGRVNQALSAAMEIILGDYLAFIEGIESEIKRNSIKLLGLRYHIQSKAENVTALATAAARVQEAKSRGGHTLSILHSLVMNEVPKSPRYTLFRFLISQASVPYLESVQKWVFQGIIYDPYNEFMIQGHTLMKIHRDIATEEYWSKRYLVRKQYVPNFLKDIEDQIFNSGRYLNAVRKCSSTHPIDSPMEKLVYSIKGTDYVEAIQRGYRFSSKKFLDIMIHDYKIIDRIKSIKRYLLLQQGDFVVQIFDTCEEELKKPVADVNPSRLSALIEMAVRIPSTSDDIYRDDITVTIKPQDLTFQIFKILSIMTEEENYYKNPEENMSLTGLEAFALGLKKKWPVSLVFNHKIVSCYQMIFRHLMYCKYIEQLLNKVWLWNCNLKSLSPEEMEGYMRAVALRHKMMVLVQHLEYYMMEEAIELNWHEFLSQVPKIENIDDLLKLHWNFLDSCMNDCLLTNPALFKSFRKLLNICKEFGEFIEYINRPKSHCDSDQFEANVIRLDEEFQTCRKQFITEVSSIVIGDLGEKLINLLFRLGGLGQTASFDKKT